MADECRKRFVALPQVFVAQFVKIFVPAGGIPRMFDSVEQGPNFGTQLVHNNLQRRSSGAIESALSY